MKKLLCVVLLTLSVLISKSQNQDTSLSVVNFQRSYFGDMGLGIGTMDRLSFHNHFTAELNKGISFTFGLANVFDFSISKTTDYIEGESIFFGLGTIEKTKPFLFLWSVGPSYTRITYHHLQDVDGFLGGMPETDEVNDVRTVGLHVQLQLLSAWKFIGGGLTAFVNLNPESSYAGITHTITIGKIHFWNVREVH